MITRAQMQRQLRNEGGVMTIKTIRKKYGLGDLVGDVGNFVRKLIPNELADVAVKAAPFVAPFNPLAAAAMRGIGRFDQRGNISDALKQGALTYAGGRGVRYLGGAEGASGGLDSFSMDKFREGPIGSLFKSDSMTPLKKTGTGLTIKKLPQGVAKQLVAGGVTAGASLLASYFQGEFREQEPGETMEDYLAARKEAVGSQMRTYMDNYFKFDKDYSTMTDAQRDAFVARYNVRDGGIIRLGFSDGTKKPRAYEVLIDKEGLAKEAEERADRINKLAEKISKEKGISFDEALDEAIAIITPNTFSNDGKTNIDELDESPVTRAEKMANYKAFSKLLDYGRQFPPFLKSIPIKYNKLIDDFETMQKERFMYDSPKMKKGGLMNIPVRKNSEGIKELDMRKTGGFVPIGVKEKADDVPAMLSKNEFVMTADAVRAAGGGSINKGAQRMYDTMKKLESRVA